MPTLHFIGGQPGHEVEVGQYERIGQGWARCECGWTRQDAMFDLTNRGALIHVQQMKQQAKAEAKALALEPVEE